MNKIDVEIVNYISRAFKVAAEAELMHTAEIILEIAKMIQTQEIHESY